MNLNVSSHTFFFLRYMNTGAPEGMLNLVLLLGSRCTPIQLYSSPGLHFINFFLVFFYVYLAFCVGDGELLAGCGIAPNTRNMGQSSSDPMVSLASKTAIWTHSIYVASPFLHLFLSLTYALRKGTCYLSIIPIYLRFSIGDSSN